MICSGCGAYAPYVAGGECMICNAPLRLSSRDILGDGPKMIVSEARPQQIELAETIEKAMLANKHVIAEAGTGVGKSFGLLIPAILAKKKTIVSTATLALQDQYYEKDLPFLVEKLGALGFSFRFALAKGKANYVCKQKINTLKIKTDTMFKKWLEKTEFGDKRELGRNIPRYWSKITCEDCVGEKLCPLAHECRYIKAKALLLQADVIIANHSIMGFSILLGPGKLLPACAVYIADEAHQATGYFRNALAARLNEVTLPNTVGYMLESGAAEMIHTDGLDEIERLNEELFNKFAVKYDGAQEHINVSKFGNTVADLEMQLDNVNGRLETSIKNEMREFQPDKNKLSILTVANRKVDRAQRTLSKLGTADPDEDVVFIAFPRTKKAHRELVAAPIFIGNILAERLHCNTLTVAASATLAMGTDFSYRKKELGLADGEVVEFITDSPFDYGQQSLLYCSNKTVIHPSRRGLRGSEYDEGLIEYYEKMANEIRELLGYSEGGAFVLATSFVEMQQIFERVKQNVDLPMQIQEKDVSAASLGEWFKSTKNGVLWGTRTWWQGADFPGDILRMVIMVKAPFPIRGDLIYTAKKEILIKKYGGDSRKAFQQLDVPEMIGDVRQGLGRLIRSMSDYGVAVVLDRKITDQGNRYGTYAHSLIQALPFTRITQSERDVIKFFKRHRGKKHE